MRGQLTGIQVDSYGIFLRRGQRHRRDAAHRRDALRDGLRVLINHGQRENRRIEPNHHDWLVGVFEPSSSVRVRQNQRKH